MLPEYVVLMRCCWASGWAHKRRAVATSTHPVFQVTRGLGCGGNPELGRQAATESEEALRRMVQVRRDIMCPTSPHMRIRSLHAAARECSALAGDDKQQRFAATLR